ncbi:MAG: PqqD family protein [Pyrinomonadaceae bacterium]
MNESFLPTEFFPKARVDGLLTQDVKGETLVYDTRSNRAFCLNSPASAVWSLCDGQNDLRSFTETLKSEKKIDSNTEVISLAIHELASNGLLTETPEISEFTGRFNRRQAIRNIGIATAFALPVISSITAPLAANAQSAATPTGGYCTSSCALLGGPCACLPAIASGSCPSGLSLNLSLGLGVCVSAGAAVGDIELVSATAGVNACVLANVCVSLTPP